jgi:hypothetical protein
MTSTTKGELDDIVVARHRRQRRRGLGYFRKLFADHGTYGRPHRLPAGAPGVSEDST